MLFERFFLACDSSPYDILTYRMKILPRSPFIVSPYSRLVSTLLRDRNLTLRGCPERRKPSTYGVPLSKKGQIRYSCPHAQYSALQSLFQEIFYRLEYAPLPSLYLYKGIHSFGESLSPVTSSAQKKVSSFYRRGRPTRCYAFSQGWLLPSLPLGCPPFSTSFYLEIT